MPNANWTADTLAYSSYFGTNYSNDADYDDYCMDCNSIFGCIGLKKKENAILN